MSHVFITGNSRGIGLALSEEFQRSGLGVSGCSSKHSGGVVNLDAMRFFAAANPETNILVCNAGVCLSGVAEDVSVLLQNLSVNLIGVANSVAAFLPGLRVLAANKVGDGISFAIAALGSGWGQSPGKAGFAAYSASKHALEGYMGVLAREIAGDKGVAVVIDPGVVDTALNPSIRTRGAKADAVAKAMVEVLLGLKSSDNGRRISLGS